MNNSLLKLFAFVSLAMSAFHGVAAAYTFTPGEPIPLYGDGADVDYLTDMTNVKVSSDHTFLDGQQGAISAAFALNNPVAGSYVLVVEGSHEKTDMTLTVTISNEDGYSKEISFVQAFTGNWNTYRANYFIFEDLPAGELSLVFKTSNGSPWTGHYRNFTFNNFTWLEGDGFFNVLNQEVAPFSIDGSYLTVTGDGSKKDDKIDGTKTNAKLTFALYCPRQTRLDYSFRMAMDGTAQISWKFFGRETNLSFGPDRRTGTGWTDTSSFSHECGILKPGVYFIEGTTARIENEAVVNGWSGNYSDFAFAVYEVLDVTENTILPVDWTGAISSIAAGVTIDLNGNDLEIGSSCTMAGEVRFTNSNNEKSSVLTVDSGNNKLMTFDGNLKYVAAGQSGTGENRNFRGSQDANAEGVVEENTHAGGTALKDMGNGNLTYIYNVAVNIGTGPVVFAGGGRVGIPSSNLIDGYATITNDIQILGANNRFEIEGYSWGPGFNLNGNFSGDGDLYLCNGWQPNIFFNGAANDDFTGTLYLAYCRNTSRGFYIGENAVGFKNATVCLTNKYTSANGKVNGDVHSTRLTFQQRGEDVYFGHLVTDDAPAVSHTNTQLVANHGGVTTLHVGSLNKSGSLAAKFVEQAGKTFKLVKEGSGTLALNAPESVGTISGGITVTGGKVIAPASFTAVANEGTLLGVSSDHRTYFPDTLDVSSVEDVQKRGMKGETVEILTIEGQVEGAPTLVGTLYRDGKGAWKYTKTYSETTGLTVFGAEWCPAGLVIMIL